MAILSWRSSDPVVVGRDGNDIVKLPSIDRKNSSIDPNRSAGVGDNARFNAASTLSGTLDRSIRTGVCCPTIRSVRNPSAFAATCADTPASISYSTSASAY